MDKDVADELHKIMGLSGIEAQDGAKRMLIYIKSMGHLPNEYRKLAQEFLDFSFKILPSSAIPQAFAKFFNLKSNYKKKVTVGKTTFYKLPVLGCSSKEAIAQRAREAASPLSIVNTDPYKKFKPRFALEDDKKNNNTANSIVYTGLINMARVNLFTRPVSIVKNEYKRININIDDFILQPEKLDMFMRR